MGKVSCFECNKTCKDQALKLGDRHFHVQCFKCKECSTQLPPDCFYLHDGNHYCADDYLNLFSVKCHLCYAVVEGEAVTILGHTYHTTCFRCSACQKNLEPGDKVTFTSSSADSVICNVCRPMSSMKSAAATDDEDDWKPPNRESTGSRCGSRADVDYSRFYNASYLDKSIDFKRGPSINPNVEKSPIKHYHRPDNFSYSSVRRDFIVSAKRETSVLTDVDCVDYVAPPRSGKLDIYSPMAKTEPIRLSKFPDAHRMLRQRLEGTQSSCGYSDGMDQVDAANGSDGEVISEKNNSESLFSRSYDGREMSRPASSISQYGGSISLQHLYSSGDAEWDPTTGLKNTHLRSMYLCDGFISPYARRHRRMISNVLLADEPKKIYPYEQLLMSNLNLPPGVERQSVERHLSPEDFERLFNVSRDDFYRMAEWKRNDLKLKVGLF